MTSSGSSEEQRQYNGHLINDLFRLGTAIVDAACPKPQKPREAEGEKCRDESNG